MFMVVAYVLVHVPAKEALELVGDLKKIPQITEVAGVYGDTDVIVKIETHDMQELDKLVFQSIQGNRHVGATKTYVVIGDQHWMRSRQP